MGSFKDLTGQTFNRLTALYPLKERKNGSVVWHCKCECGNECDVVQPSLVKGRTKSCGCLKKETDRAPKGHLIDMVGKKYGHLTVISRDGSDKYGHTKWICECDCENKTKISVLGGNLRKGHTLSCGCERRSHGEIKIAELLLKNKIPFETEKSFFNYDNQHRAPFDFYVNNSYLIEYDGETHDLNFASKHGWITEESITKQIERDNIKNQWCKENNIPLIRIPYTHLDDLKLEDLLLETTEYLVK